METKIKNLISQLTLEEKILLLSGRDLWHTEPIDRLNLPAMKVTDGPNGARGAFGDSGPTSACVPVGVALAATWNPELIFRVGQLLGEETKAKGAHILLGPTVNIHRSPLAGRNFECFSEDPYLAGQIASAYIKGLQSQGVGACIKHFVCNDSEFERNSISSEVADRPLHEIYLEPFRTAIREAKPWAVMSSYNKINGIYASENPYTLLEILKGAWGFDGLVISDWFGTYSEAAVNGGLDLEMPGPGVWMTVEKTKQAIKDGQIKVSTIDDKIRRLLLTYQRVGLFDEPSELEEKAIDKKEHRQIALEAAIEAVVLLKNDNNLLPISNKKFKSIGIIGANAKDFQVMGGGSSRVTPHYVVSPLEGIKKLAGDTFDVRYTLGCPTHRNLPTINMDWLFAEGGKSNGLSVGIFDNMSLGGKPVNKFTLDRPSITWLDSMLIPAQPTSYSARLSGTFIPPQSGDYSFSLEGSGISRLYIDGKLIVDNWFELPEWIPLWSSGQVTGKSTFSKDQEYTFVIEFSSNNPSPWRGLKIGCLPPLPDNPIEEAVRLAKETDVVILVAGTSAEWESEGFDRANMALPADQKALIESVVAVNPNTIVVLNTGAPVDMDWIDKVPSVLQTWFGGQEAGNAVAAVLFGVKNPSGKLPTTFPKRLQDNPAYINYPGENGQVHYGEGIYVGYRYYDFKDVEPRFAFGHGLSYTSFEYSNLRLSALEFGPEDEIQIFVNVTNAGEIAGKETIQVYLQDLVSTLVRPVKELKAFRKVFLEPGETKTVLFTLSRDSLAFYDPKTKSWITEAGEFELQVGSSSRDIRQRVKFNWAGDTIQLTGEGAPPPIYLPLKALLSNEHSQKVLEKYLGQLLTHRSFDREATLSLRDLASFLPRFLTEEKLSAINKELEAALKGE